MKKNILTLMALAVALSACTKEQTIGSETPTPDVTPQEATVFTATMENAPIPTQTKATFDNTYKCASWEIGDLISINGAIYQAQTSGTSTIFNGTGNTEEIRPTYVSTSTPDHWGELEAKMLVDDSGVTNEWCTPTSAKKDGTWNIVVTTGDPTVLSTIKLWNARNTVTNYGRTWKKVKVYGSASSNGSWKIIGDFDNLNLDINNYGFAGDLEINATEAYTYYKIDVLENKGGTGDDYMQMADMKFDVVSSPITAPYDAYFPASLFDGFSATLPSTINETWQDGKFNMPMYAESTTTDLNFKNLCGVLKIIVKNSQMDNVKHITVISSNLAMSGSFTVDANNVAILQNPTDASLTKTVNYTNAVQTSAEGTVFYVAIPAQTYQDLTIVVSDGIDCKDMVTKSGRDIVVERNKIYPVTFEDNTPYSGFGIAVIDGVEVYVPWVQLWEGGPKWATYNVGASSVTESGKYYAWGDTKGYLPSGSTFSHTFSWSYCPYTKYGVYGDNPTNRVVLSKYIPSDREIQYCLPGIFADNRTILAPEDDAATQNWGGNWRMPTKDEIEEFILISKATKEKTDNYNGTGVSGYTFTGNGNTIFFPAAGYAMENKLAPSCEYWTSSLVEKTPEFAYSFNPNNSFIVWSQRRYGLPIRAVMK